MLFRVTSCLLLMCVPLVFISYAAESTPIDFKAQRAARVKQMRAELRGPVQGILRVLDRPDATPGLRDLTEGALAALLIDEPPAKAEALIRLAFAQQISDEKSKDFGTVPWQMGHTEIKDANSIEFTLQPLGPLLKEFGAKLSPELKHDIVPWLKAGIVAMKNHKVRVQYTNIFLMKAVNCILLGEYLADDDAIKTGYTMFDEWCAYTKKFGVHEFASPTYYAVDLESLGVAYVYAARAEARPKFKAALDLFWTEISARYFAPRESFSGAFSRDYDFLTGRGGLGRYLWAEGFASESLGSNPGMAQALSILGMQENGYTIDGSIRALSKTLERVIQQLTGEGAGQDAYTYVTPDFSLGSSSSDYGPQDKLVSLELNTGEKNSPVFQIVADWFDLPYGKNKTIDRSGHSKPKHASLGPCIVQAKGAMLGLLQPYPGRDEATSFTTNFLIPLKASEMLLNGKPVDLSKEISIPIEENATFAARYGNTGLALKIFHANGLAGYKSRLELKTDAEGLKNGVARLVATHYQGSSKVLNDVPECGFVLWVQPCVNSEALKALSGGLSATKVARTRDAQSWNAVATFPWISLEASCELRTRKILARKINGNEFKYAALDIDGQEPACMTALAP